MSEFTSKVGEYKGYPTISLEKDNERFFSTGVKKAQVLLEIFNNPEAIEALKAFVEANTKEEVSEL